MLTEAEQGLMVIVTLDLLWSKTAWIAVTEEKDLPACCPHCCAPCGLLDELARSDRLDAMVRLAPTEHFASRAWWRDNRVDRQWMQTAWGCTAHPPCDYGASDDNNTESTDG